MGACSMLLKKGIFKCPAVTHSLLIEVAFGWLPNANIFLH